MRYLLLSFFLVLSLSSFCQENTGSTNRREISSYKNFISGQAGISDPWAGVVYEHVFFGHWGLDIGVGLLGGSIGTKLYIPKLSDNKFSAYIGISEGMVLIAGYRHYIPIGFTYINENAFRVSIDVGPQLDHDNPSSPYFGISVRFGAGIKRK